MLRRTLFLAGAAFFGLGTVEAIFLALDLYGYFDVVRSLMERHPMLDHFFHSQMVSPMILAFGLALLITERKLKEPNIEAIFERVNLEWRLDNLDFAVIAGRIAKQVGKSFRADCDFLAEVYLVNHADIPVTVRAIEGEFFHRKHWWSKKRKLPATFRPNIEEYRMNDAPLKTLSYLLETALERGIGHRGWLRFELLDISDADASGLKCKIRIVDALGLRHTIKSKRKLKTTMLSYRNPDTSPVTLL